MRSFRCACGNRIFFENTLCVQCGRALAFLPEPAIMAAIEPCDDDLWRPVGAADPGTLYRKCANFVEYDVCNWMVPTGDSSIYCHACRLNHLIPDLGISENLSLWFRIEGAKRRLVRYRNVPPQV